MYHNKCIANLECMNYHETCHKYIVKPYSIAVMVTSVVGIGPSEEAQIILPVFSYAHVFSFIIIVPCVLFL